MASSPSRPTFLSTVLTIAGRDTRGRLRDRSAIITAFVAPLALAGILSFALGGGDDFQTTFLLVQSDEGDVGEAFADVLAGEDIASFAEVVRVEDRVTARRMLLDGDGNAAFVTQAGLSTAVAVGLPGVVEVLTTADSPTSGAIAEAIASGFAADVDARVTATRLAIATGREVPAISSDPLPEVLELRAADAEEVRDIAGSYFGPAMATFFVFFIAGLLPQSLLRERRESTLPRVLAAPVRPGAVLLGKALGVVGLSIVSMLVLWAATTVLLGADWGAPLGVVALIVAFVAAATAVTTFVATIARTEEQANGYVSIVVFLFALLGGSFVRIDQMPDALAAVAGLTPNGAALSGFVDLIAGQPASAVAVPVVALFAATALFAALSWPQIKALVEP